jgi:hypothetical protein
MIGGRSNCHSGAPRSGEPGIHTPCARFWIPDSRRFAPVSGMTNIWKALA